MRITHLGELLDSEDAGYLEPMEGPTALPRGQVDIAAYFGHRRDSLDSQGPDGTGIPDEALRDLTQYYSELQTVMEKSARDLWGGHNHPNRITRAAGVVLCLHNFLNLDAHLYVGDPEGHSLGGAGLRLLGALDRLRGTLRMDDSTKLPTFVDWQTFKASRVLLGSKSNAAAGHRKSV